MGNFGPTGLNAYSTEVGRVYRSEVDHRADAKRATCTVPKRAMKEVSARVVGEV